MKKLTTVACTVALASVLSSVPAQATTFERLGDACEINFTVSERKLYAFDQIVFTKDEAPLVKSEFSKYLSWSENSLEEAEEGSEEAKRSEAEIAIAKSVLNHVEECVAVPVEEDEDPADMEAQKSSSSTPWIAALIGLGGAVIGGLVTAFGIVPALKDMLPSILSR